MLRRKLGVKNNPIKEKVPFLQKINIWKWLFLGLVSLLLAFAIVVQGRLATPREDVSQLHQTVGTKDVKVGTMTTTRDQLNDTIKSLLKKYLYPIYAACEKGSRAFLLETVRSCAIAFGIGETDENFSEYENKIRRIKA